MKEINIADLESLSLGAAILGSGGGGDPKYNQMITQYAIEQHGPVKIRSVRELKATDIVVPMAFMGAPLVALETLPSGKEFSTILKQIESDFHIKPSVIMPAEIGGGNAFTPLWVSVMKGIPVLDADLIGRAFPQLQMSTCTLNNVSASPAYLSDAFGDTVVIKAGNAHVLERLARHVVVGMGSRAAVALHLMGGVLAKATVVQGSLSKAIAIGNAVIEARHQKKDPATAVTNLVGGISLISGVIEDVNHRVENGFLMGKTTIRSDDGRSVVLEYQNEFLLARENVDVLATTPDIITLMEQETGSPITTASLAYGLRVDLIILPSPDVWKTVKGLELVGPRYFGYDCDYKGVI